MLKLYRRHGRTRKGVSTCKHKKLQFDPWMKCDCPIHVVGMVESSGKFLRRFTGTRTLSEAQAKAAFADSLGDWPDLPTKQSKQEEQSLTCAPETGPRFGRISEQGERDEEGTIQRRADHWHFEAA